MKFEHKVGMKARITDLRREAIEGRRHMMAEMGTGELGFGNRKMTILRYLQDKVISNHIYYFSYPVPLIYILLFLLLSISMVKSINL